MKDLDNIWETSGRHPGRCVRNHQMGSGSQITLFGKCTFRIPSGYLPDFTRDKFEPFQVSLLQTNMENSKNPSGFTSGNPSGTFRIPSGMQCFAACRKPSGFPSGNPSGTFRKPSGMQCFQHASFFYKKNGYK